MKTHGVDRKGSYFVAWWLEGGRRREMSWDHELWAWEWLREHLADLEIEKAAQADPGATQTT